MADTTITGLPNASALTGTERVPMDQAGTTVDAAASAIAALATAATVGLGNCNNTSDLAKPISTATQTALDLKANANDARLIDSREWSAATATQAEAEAGSSTTRLAFTPQRVFQAIAAWWAASADKSKLDGVATGATANSSDATLLARANHTGTQAFSTISSTPTTLSGYGITDAVGTSDARLSDARTPTAHNQAWSTITSTPTTLSGYGITDGFTQANVRATPITGFTSGAGAVAATDTILQAIQKLDGNDAAKLPITFTAGTITYAATVDLDLAALAGGYRTISLTGALTFTTSNRASGRQVTIRLICDSTARALTFPAGWTFLGTKPSTIAASKTAVLSLTFFGTADSDCVAAYGVQA